MFEELDLLIEDTKEQMEKTIKALENEFALVRTGRANPQIVSNIKVNYYGVDTPIQQISTVSVVEGNQLYIKPFDKQSLKEIEAQINASDLDLPTTNDGTGIRLVLPKLTEERRKETCKEVEKKAELGKVAIRNIRRKANDELKKLGLPEDNEHESLDDIQELTDEYIKTIDTITNAKKEEVLKI